MIRKPLQRVPFVRDFDEILPRSDAHRTLLAHLKQSDDIILIDPRKVAVFSLGGCLEEPCLSARRMLDACPFAGTRR